jgi:hypothetical protein
VNDRIYIHELIDIRGHNRASYMHHMTANWSPTAQEQRHQLCYGVWSLLGSTGQWPQVVNMWEEDGFEGLARSFGIEAVGAGAQDPKLEKWWATAAEFRSGGFDRIMVPAPWTSTIEELCVDGVTGTTYAHELIRVRPGSAKELLEQAREVGAPALAEHGWRLVGAFTTAMANDDEALLLWAIPSWQHWADGEAAHSADGAVRAWRAGVAPTVTSWHRTLLVDAPLSPFRTHRQPSVDDRTDWVD